VFLEVVRALPRFEGGHSEFRTWVFTIAHHRLVDDFRRRRRRPHEPAAPEIPAGAESSGNVEDDALAPLRDEEVRRVLERLSSAQRDVLTLRILVGFTIAETARVLGKRPGAVKSLQVRGLAALKREISAEGVSFTTPPAITETE
jgi:RNA polymerase sigma-70 factor (ECF subfamily)